MILLVLGHESLILKMNQQYILLKFNICYNCIFFLVFPKENEELDEYKIRCNDLRTNFVTGGELICIIFFNRNDQLLDTYNLLMMKKVELHEPLLFSEGKYKWIEMTEEDYNGFKKCY